MKKYLVHIVWLVVVIVALVGGIYYGKSTAASAAGRFGGAGASSTRTGFTGRGGAAGGGFVAGQILSLGAGSMTIQLANGNSQVVFYSSSTAVIKPEPAPVSSLMPGTMVMIGGTTNSDGSLTAQSIQVRTAGASGFGGGGAAGSGAGATGGTAGY
jgi:Domain of unknown function (DUF5666)